MSIRKKIWTGTKIVVLSISFLIYAFFIFRLCSGGDPESVAHVLWNEPAKAAYREDASSFAIWEQEPVSIITDDGRFWISNVLYLPSAKQLQITVKYNNSTVKYLKQDLQKALQKQLAEEAGDGGSVDVPEPEIEIPDEPFDYTLLDDLGNRYAPTYFESAEKLNYNYRRLVFDHIEMTETSSFYIDMYYVGAIDYTAAPYGSLLAWHNRMSHDTREVQEELPDELLTKDN